MIKNYFFILSFVLITFNLSGQAEASNANHVEQFKSDFAANASKFANLNSTSGWTANNNASWQTNNQLIQNGATWGRLNVRRNQMRHQWNTPITAAVGDIITLKMSFRLSGTGFSSGNDVFQLGLKSSLDASNAMTTGQEQESFIVELDSNNHLGLKNKSDLATAEYQQSGWDTLTIKYFIGENVQDSRIYAQLDNQGTKSGWMKETWNNDASRIALYDAIVSGSGAYLFFLSGNALTNAGGANHLHINQYDLWTDGSDTGLVMIGANTTWDSHSSTGSKPASSSDRIFIFDQDVNFSGGYGRNWGYLFVDSGASFDWRPSSATNLTLSSADIYGTLQSTTTAGTVTITNLDIESGGTVDFQDAGSFTSSNMNVAGTLNLSTSGDITSTTSTISGNVNISGADNVTLTNLSFGDSSGNVDFSSSSFTEGKVKVSESTTYVSTTTFDNNFTLDSSSGLSVAPAGFLLKTSSYYNGFDSSSFWSKYVDGIGWETITGTFPDDASFDYSNSNLIYNSQAYGNGGLKVNGEVGDFDFNDIIILDGKRMVINGTSISAENIVVEDSSDPFSIIMYGGAIKASNPFSCNVQYNRYIDVDRWYAIASPVSGQDIDEFIAGEDLAVSSNISAVGLANYVNDASLYDGPSEFTPVDTGFWDYYEAGQSDSGDFTVGEGKIVRLASDATDQQITFEGTVNNGNFDVAISSNTVGFNFVANPYLCPININAVANATHNALTLNESSLTEMTAWLWNGAANNGEGGYQAFNQNPSEEAQKIAPIRGFFVSAAGTETFSLTTDLQADGEIGSFARQTEWSKIDLSMSADSQSSETEIVYFDGATTGWDNGYDSTNWSSGSFQIFTSHVDTSTSQNLAIQSLPLGNFNDMVVPVGVNASAGQTITISVDTTNWPEGINIYLEDVDNGSYTLLDGQNAEFTTLLDSNESGIGRFYIHTTSNSLGDEDLALTDVSIYASSRDNLRILGINSGQANVQMFDLMGKQVLNTSFNGQSVNDVKLPNLNTGIYLVNLASDEGTINKKIIIQ